MPYSKNPRSGKPSRNASPRMRRKAQMPASSSYTTHAAATFETSPHRLSILLVVVLAIAIIVFGRLVWVQIIDAHAIEHASDSQRTVTVDVEPRRGTIYDRNGVVLTISSVIRINCKILSRSIGS